MSHSRRAFLQKAAILGAGFSGLRLHACKSIQNRPASRSAVNPDNFTGPGYGPLLPDPQEILDLPAGFSYRIISRQGDRMTDGLRVPGLADGMGTFEGENGRVIIVRNHELSPNDSPAAFSLDALPQTDLKPTDFYDFGSGRMPAIGGTTTIVYNEETGDVEQQFVSLIGTIRNCAGGVAPWGSWLTCEEDVTLAGSHEGAMQQDHGYVFEVPATMTPQRAAPTPIRAMGRFNHEAVAVDPRTGTVYLTEDRQDGLLYRYLPDVPGSLHQGGTLQALSVRNQKSFDTRNWPDFSPEMETSTTYDIAWIDLDDIESRSDDLRHRGAAAGAAVFARGEGIWYGDGEVYFACTSGGRERCGQLFRLVPRAGGTDTLELFIEPNDTEIMKSCDNLTVAPFGDVMLCEDDPDPYLRGVTLDGNIYTFAHNVGHRSEFAGICFSPSGKTLFVNIQNVGLTFAVTGPWKSA